MKNKKQDSYQLLNKRGVETLIAWVLLVGLGITLAALVTNWAIGNVKKFEPKDIVDSDLYCEGVSISINNTCHIRNTGVFGIDKLIVSKIAGSSNKTTLPGRLLPGEAKNLNSYVITCDPGTTFTPVTKSDEGADVVCSVKKIQF